MLFKVPHAIWKTLEGGKIESIVKAVKEGREKYKKHGFGGKSLKFSLQRGW